MQIYEHANFSSVQFPEIPSKSSTKQRGVYPESANNGGAGGGNRSIKQQPQPSTAQVVASSTANL